MNPPGPILLLLVAGLALLTSVMLTPVIRGAALRWTRLSRGVAGALAPEADAQFRRNSDLRGIRGGRRGGDTSDLGGPVHSGGLRARGGPTHPSGRACFLPPS